MVDIQCCGGTMEAFIKSHNVCLSLYQTTSHVPIQKLGFSCHKWWKVKISYSHPDRNLLDPQS